MTRCNICERPCLYEVEPAFGSLPAEFVDDVWTVAMRNHIYVDACHSCWMAWPDDHKVFPPVGFGRWPDDEPEREYLTIHDGLLDVLGPV